MKAFFSGRVSYMRICCPFCKVEREIEHTFVPCNIECTCGQKFPLEPSCITEEYSEIDCILPDHIGKYKILELIGFGGMGKIYKAEHPDLKIPIALKSLKKEFANDERACGRFIRSAKICARISHPNVVRIYDCGYSEEDLYLVMEYIDGGSVQDLLEKKGKLSPEETVQIAIGVCTGLIEAESRKIVHRDIKPENIMFDANGTVKLLDLGLAKISGDARINEETKFAETLINTSLGTAEYMSPEQALDAKSCDCRSDIYSLGATMYHLLTGKYPFGSGDPVELKRKHALEELVPPGEHNKLVPPALDQIIMKCMAKKRPQRYQSAKTLLLDLKAFAAGETILPSFQIPRKTFFTLFRKWENTFNRPFFEKWPSWADLVQEMHFLSPFRLLILLVIMAITAGFSAYLSTDLSKDLPLDIFLEE